VILQADVHHIPIADNSVDLVFCSPPYEAARTYGIEFNLKGQQWVDWAVAGYLECLRVCRGLVAWVVEGQTRQFRWSATPALLMADLHRAGVRLRKPPAFHRVGIPGSGGPDWLRNDYEFIVCAAKAPGRLPWSDNTAMGHPPKWAPGGEMSHRLSNGARVNQWGKSWNTAKSETDKEGNTSSARGQRPSHRLHTKRRVSVGGDVMELQSYLPPVRANPGNVIHCKVGGGKMGHKLAHKNEAPFPEALAEFFIRSFCPPGGIVLDPFSGSGTTVAVAERFGRRFIAADLRMSQCELTCQRLSQKIMEQMA
jgi:hypothetical protein